MTLKRYSEETEFYTWIGKLREFYKDSKTIPIHLIYKEVTGLDSSSTQSFRRALWHLIHRGILDFGDSMMSSIKQGSEFYKVW